MSKRNSQSWNAPRNLVTLPLQAIRFTQDSIKGEFSDGRSFDSAIADLREGRLLMGDEEGQFPRITVFRLSEFWISLDNRRLYCLKLAFLHQSNHEVEVWHEETTPRMQQELAWKFTSGLSLTVRGTNNDGCISTLTWKGRKKGRGNLSVGEFLAKHLTEQQIEQAREALRVEYEDQVMRLKREMDEKMQLLDDLRNHHQTDESVIDAVVDCLGESGPLDLRGLMNILPDAPSTSQLSRVLDELVACARLVCRTSTFREARYALPGSPWAHSRLSVHRDAGHWVLISSAASRQHSVLDGRSLAEQSAYVGCSLSSSSAVSNTMATVKLRGTWAKGDKLLIGVWPDDTDVDRLFYSPGPDAQAASELQIAPGYWVSCSSGYLLSGGHRYSPLQWSAPAKVDGVIWGIRFSSSGQLQFAYASPGNELSWEALAWNRGPELPAAPNGWTLAVLLQPHNRPDDSQAALVIE